MLVTIDYVVAPLETRRRASLTPALEANLGIPAIPFICEDPLRPPVKLGSVCSAQEESQNPHELPAAGFFRSPSPKDSLGMILPQYYPVYSSQLKSLRFMHPGAAKLKDAASCPLLDPPQDETALYQWSYDVTGSVKDQASVLATVGYKILQDFNVAKSLRLPATEAPALLFNWLNLIETVYHHANPYHNNVHAADVLQCVSYFLLDAVLRSRLSDLDVAALLLGAAMHDADHPGVSSQYLINRKHDLAQLYNDISVLENHHLALSFHLSTKVRPDCNIFKYLTCEEYKLIRSRLVSIILATDMARHNKV